MASTRKTTLEERLEIVLYCLEHGKNYSQTASKFQCSYQQVWNWVKKYMENGEDGRSRR